jgi:putative ABC transport system permease protein
MKTLRAWLVRFSDLFRSRRRDAELSAELESHLQLHIDDNLRAGMPPQEARRQALIKLGGLEQTKQLYLEQGGLPFLDSLLQDVRFSVRTLRKSASFTAVAVFTLALGIAASTIVFSVAYNVFFHGLPYKEFNRSVVFEIRNTANAGGWKGRAFFSPDEFRALRDQNHVFEDMIAYAGLRALYNDGKTTRYLPVGGVVSTNTFAYLGVSPMLGRSFSNEDGEPGAPRVFVMNYRLWQQEFGGDPRILGTSFSLDGKPTTLIGIMPPQFNAFHATFWIPGLNAGGVSIVGRLKPGISVQAAQADLDVIAHRLQKANPSGIFPANFAVFAEPLLDSMIGNFKTTLYALLAAVLLLLLIASSNVANLLLARATTREREMAMRSALGATRMRLIRQLLVETLALAMAASMVGCGLAYFGLGIVVRLIPTDTLPDATVIRLNSPVMFLTLGVTVLTAILCGLAPSVHILRSDLQPQLSGGNKGAGGSLRHGKLRAALVVSEVALSIVLLVGSGILMRSFLVLTRTNLGFNPENVLYFRFSLPDIYNFNFDDPASIQQSRQRKNALSRNLLDAMSGLPGVVSAAEVTQEPPLNSDWSDTILPGRPHAERWETKFESCSEGYFQTLGLPLIRGRLFTREDVAAARYLLVVNDTFARQYFPNQDPLGQKVKLEVLDRPFLDAPHDTYFEIIGIVGAYKVRDHDTRSWQAFSQVFFPYSVQGYSWRTFLVRTTGDPNSLLNSIRAEVHRLDPGVQIATSGTIDGALNEYYRGPQFELMTLAVFAFVGLVLAVVGIFSVMAYTVSLKIHEIGVRMALGAQRSNILRSVLLSGFRLVSAGAILGLVASYATTRFLAGQISGVSTRDPLTLTVAMLVILATGAVASFLPARRATRVDPVVALRCE